VTVPCGLTDGDPPVTIRWLYNGHDIPSNVGVVVVKLGELSTVLSISSVSEKNAGNYTCIAANSAGIDSFSSTLVVNGKWM
jgi:hypothetical protein